MAGLIGASVVGVGRDIVNYLTEAAVFFRATIVVTSGYRSPDGQAQAMLNNWVKLEHGRVYKPVTLPEVDRAKLDKLFQDLHQASLHAKDKEQAKAEFLKLAKERVGSKSLHTQGRAIDVARASITPQLYKAITLSMQEVHEGKRHDIYHFQSMPTIPQVDAATKEKWQAIQSGSHVPKEHHVFHPPGKFVVC